MRKLSLVVVLVLLAVGLPACGWHIMASQTPRVATLEVLSKTYLVDRMYRSMKGPQSTQGITLGEKGTHELYWIRGYTATMVAEDGKTAMPQEFMCHSNLDFAHPQNHYQSLGDTHNYTSRLFTLSQGQFQIDFPEGYGIPIMSDDPLNLTTQVLNLNPDNPKSQVRHKVDIHFVRQRDLRAPMRPLFPTSAYGLAVLNGREGYYNEGSPDESTHGPGCLAGNNASPHNGGTFKDRFGRQFAGHWVVKPGREVNHTPCTHLINLPYDTTLHYIAVHLHPFAESLELRDLSSGGQVIFHSNAKNRAGRIGLSEVEHFESVPGIPLYKTHNYQITSVYNNTTSEDQDSMAVMYMYCLDKEFRLPQSAASGLMAIP